MDLQEGQLSSKLEVQVGLEKKTAVVGLTLTSGFLLSVLGLPCPI
jgi:hypothetical protein